jgi:hypothetical protein
VALWGLGGGGAIELVDLYNIVRRSDGSYGMPPVGQEFWPAYGIAIGIRLLLGFMAAGALHEQISSPLAALGVGSGATGLIEHLTRGAIPASPNSSQGTTDEPS